MFGCNSGEYKGSSGWGELYHSDVTCGQLWALPLGASYLLLES